MNPNEPFRPGLEDVVVAETALSLVDGAGGRLVVRGHAIEDLSPLRFEEMCGLLWDGALPAPARAEAIRRGLGAGRAEAHRELSRTGAHLDRDDAMESLRAGLAALGAPAEAPERTGCRLAGAIAVVLAAWQRRRLGLAPLAPDPTRAHADDLLRMLAGAPAPAALVRGLDSDLVTVAEHGMNASTFTARVVASTRSDLVSAVVAALGALKGPLHGGAPGCTRGAGHREPLPRPGPRGRAGGRRGTRCPSPGAKASNQRRVLHRRAARRARHPARAVHAGAIG